MHRDQFPFIILIVKLTFTSFLLRCLLILKHTELCQFSILFENYFEIWSKLICKSGATNRTMPFWAKYLVNLQSQFRAGLSPCKYQSIKKQNNLLRKVYDIDTRQCKTGLRFSSPDRRQGAFASWLLLLNAVKDGNELIKRMPQQMHIEIKNMFALKNLLIYLYQIKLVQIYQALSKLDQT